MHTIESQFLNLWKNNAYFFHWKFESSLFGYHLLSLKLLENKISNEKFVQASYLE